MYYICRDYLGSITHIVNSSNSQVQEYSYDAWGRLRDPVSQIAYTPGNEPALLLNRGYTSHEHLPQFGLINMNARLYNPAVGRFLSPDPYVQAPDFSQNFNRYSYALNNPLVYTDPDGEIVWAAIAYGAMVGGISNAVRNASNINNMGQFLAYFGVGAAAGAAGGLIGGAVSNSIVSGGFAGGFLSGAAGGAASGFISSTGNSLMRGCDFTQSIQNGIVGSSSGALSGGFTGGIVRGVVDYTNGYNFWNGSKTHNIIIGDAELYTKMAKNYNSSLNREIYDEMLRDAMYDEFGIKEGDYNIRNITTKTGNYGMTKSGLYYDSKNNRLIGGFVDRYSTGFSDIHISPYYTIGDVLDFRAVAGHELIHSYHHYLFGNNYNIDYSERVAHQFSYRVYANSNDLTKAIAQHNNMIKGSYLGSYPNSYLIPKLLKFSF